MNFRKILILLFFPTILSGCTNQEVQKKAYLRDISISGNEIKTVSMSFYNEDSKPTKTQSQNFDGILENSEVLNGKTIFTGHTELIILDECDYTETLRFMLEEWKVSPSCMIIYGGEDSGKIIASSDSEYLANSVRTAVKQKKIPENDIITVLSSLLQNNQCEIPVITSDGNFASGIIKN